MPSFKTLLIGFLVCIVTYVVFTTPGMLDAIVGLVRVLIQLALQLLTGLSSGISKGQQ